MSADFLEVNELTKTFPMALGFVPWVRNFGRVERKTALESVAFGVRGGELLGLLGTIGTLTSLYGFRLQPAGTRCAFGGAPRPVLTRALC